MYKQRLLGIWNGIGEIIELIGNKGGVKEITDGKFSTK